VTSLKQIAANRRNASRSTGPVTAQGKARASRNALRHGLSVPVYCASAVAADIGEFALQLVGDPASRTELDLARAAAEAQLELVRIRREKHLLLEVLMTGVSSPNLRAVKHLDRYERRARGRGERGRSANCRSFANCRYFDEGRDIARTRAPFLAKRTQFKR
jgi:hypothetical protein